MPKRLFPSEFESRLAFVDHFLTILGLGYFVLIILRFGFPINHETVFAFHVAIVASGALLVGQEILRIFWSKSLITYIECRWLEIIFISPILYFLFSLTQISNHEGILATTIYNYLNWTQFTVFTLNIFRNIRSSDFLLRYELTPSRLMVISFMVPIFLGMLLLKLPNATVYGISWMDALFIATSAVCVTGLSTIDVATQFTTLGKGILLVLIQIGGLGIMMITMSLGFLFTRGLAVRERIMFAELLSEKRLGRIGHLIVQVTLFTLSVEFIGAFLLYISSEGSLVNFNTQLFGHSLFHSVSAFCNAGFSLFTLGLYDPSVRNNLMFSGIIMVLIVLGGLGFPVFYNVYSVFADRLTKDKTSSTLLNTQSKLVFSSTALLLIIGTLGFFVFEGVGQFSQLPFFEKLHQSVFLSVTTRTAGFNIWPTESLSATSCALILFLMWIGGSPMSTAGGIKTLTFAVAWLNLVAIVKGKRSLIIFGREVAAESVQRSYAIVFGSLLLVLLGSTLLIFLEPKLNAFDLAFETVSAFGTVGLSRGVTGQLSDAGKGLLIGLMFIGRIGLVAAFNSFFDKFEEPRYRVLKEKISIS